MAKVKVHAGDFIGEGSYMLGSLILKSKAKVVIGETIPCTDLEMVETASEENVKKLNDRNLLFEKKYMPILQ